MSIRGFFRQLFIILSATCAFVFLLNLIFPVVRDANTWISILIASAGGVVVFLPAAMLCGKSNKRTNNDMEQQHEQDAQELPPYPNHQNSQNHSNNNTIFQVQQPVSYPMVYRELPRVQIPVHNPAKYHGKPPSYKSARLSSST